MIAACGASPSSGVEQDAIGQRLDPVAEPFSGGLPRNRDRPSIVRRTSTTSGVHVVGDESPGRALATMRRLSIDHEAGRTAARASSM